MTPEEQNIAALSDDERVRMATYILAGWCFRRYFHSSGTKIWWIAEREGYPDLTAPTLFELIGYMEMHIA